MRRSLTDVWLNLAPPLTRERRPHDLPGARLAVHGLDEDLRTSLEDNMQRILNTRRSLDVDQAYGYVRASVLAYGIAPRSSMRAGSRREAEGLAREIEHTLTSYEPRICDVKVSVGIDGGPRQHGLRFEIDARLRPEIGGGGLLASFDEDASEVSIDRMLEV